MKCLPELTLALLLSTSVSVVAMAQEAQTPASVTQDFFTSLYRMDYVKAWQLLTPKSQQEVIALILKTDPKLKAETIRTLFEQGDRAILRGFWTQLRQSIDIETWHQQRFEAGPAGASAQEAFVKVVPAGILLYTRQHNQNWKFGYVESFVERLEPPKKPESK